MKFAVFFVVIMAMSLFPESSSEAKSQERIVLGNKKCRFPKGNSGSVHVDGCIKSICKNGKWSQKMRTDVCCYKQQAHKLNTVIGAFVQSDNCTTITIGCNKGGDMTFKHTSCKAPATKHQVEQLEKKLEKQVEELSEQADQHTDEMVRQMKSMKDSNDKQSEDFLKKVDELTMKIEDMAESNENKTQLMMGEIQNLNETNEERAEMLKMQMLNMNESNERKADLIAMEIKNLNETFEKRFDGITQNLENLTKLVKDQISDNNHLSEKITNLTLLMDKCTEHQRPTTRAPTTTTTTTTAATSTAITTTPATTATTAITTTPTTASNPTTTATSGPMIEGVIITGGTHSKLTTELFVPQTGKICSLQPLPSAREDHSIDVVDSDIVLCGGTGSSSSRSCLQFLPNSSEGSWTSYATLANSKYHHTTLVVEKQLLLIGGEGSATTAELVVGGVKYGIEHTAQACGIPDGSSTIISGGYKNPTFEKSVRRYNLEGFVENLPDLIQGRRNHGCGVFTNKDNVKVYVVAGGWMGSSMPNDGYTYTTEVLTEGASAWQSGESLTSERDRPASVNMGTYILLFGGNRGHLREILKFNGSWSEVGMLKEGRYDAAAARIMINTNQGLDMTECL